MKSKIILYLAVTLLFFYLPIPIPASSNQASAANVGTDYYISSIHGNNQNSGKSRDSAWETLDMLKRVNLQPGDRILLEEGSVFNGFIHLRNVHGTAENPIIITSYGNNDGHINKPVINANGEGVWYQDYGKPLDNPGHKYKGYVSSTILIYDCDFIEISNLEITNEVNDFKHMWSEKEKVNKRMDRTGVAGIAQDDGTMRHIYLDNLYIHDVDGNLEDKHMNNGGIQFNALKPHNEAKTGIARYHNIRITNSYVKDVHRAGIVVGYTYNWDHFQSAKISDKVAKKYGHTKIYIANNYVQNIGNDGIVVMYAYKPYVKSNVADRTGADLNNGYESYWQPVSAAIWAWKTKDALFEYNEAFDTVGIGNGDGQAWDIDYSDGTVYQYNYSHNNGGGALMVCLYEAVNGVFRYNISQNDLNGVLSLPNNPKVKIYNNVFYVKEGVDFIRDDMTGGTAVIKNNIIYYAGDQPKVENWTKNSNITYSHNLYYNYANTPKSDQHAITANPQFINPGSAPIDALGLTKDGKFTHDRSAFRGYKVQEGSPVANAGVRIPNNTAYDFFGNKIGLIPDIGVYEIDNIERNVHKIFSSLYGLYGDQIIDVPKHTNVGTFIENIEKTKSTTLKVKRNQNTLSTKEIIQTGDTLVATFGDGVTKSYTIELEKTYKMYAAASMDTTAGSHQQGQVASKVLDGDIQTNWHTDWSGEPMKNIWISFDLQEIKPVSVLKYVPRQSGGVNGMFKKYSIYVKKNKQDSWQKINTYGNTWEVSNETKYAYFDTVQARYIKLQAEKVATQEYPTLFGSAAEIRIGYAMTQGGN